MVRISARVTDELHTLETSILAGVWEEIGDGEAGGREAEEQELTACQERSQKSRKLAKGSPWEGRQEQQGASLRWHSSSLTSTLYYLS